MRYEGSVVGAAAMRRWLGMVVAVSLVGCSDSTSSGGSSEFDGTVAAPDESGVISLAVDGAVASLVGVEGLSMDVAGTMGVQASTPVNGTLKIVGGGTETLTGTYNPDTKQINATGGGYTFTGTFASKKLTGSYNGPKGAGAWSAFDKKDGAVDRYCGTYSGDDSGNWNLSRSKDALAGTASSGGGAIVLTGNVSGSNVTITIPNGTATGTISGSSMSGTWSSSGDNGTWSGSKTACP